MNPKNVKAIELVLFKPKPEVHSEKVKASLTSLNSITRLPVKTVTMVSSNPY